MGNIETEKVSKNQDRQSEKRITVTVRHADASDASARVFRAIGILLSTAEEATQRLRDNLSGLMETSSSQTSTEDTVEKGNNNTGRNIRRQE